jgi:adenylate kinase
VHLVLVLSLALAGAQAQVRVIERPVLPVQGPAVSIAGPALAPALSPSEIPLALPGPSVLAAPALAPLAVEATPVRLILAGPPGAGKSTHGQRLAADLGVPHIVASDLLKEYAKTDPQVLETMKRGELVDPNLIIGLVKQRLSRRDARRGFILDGFPRRLEEARAFETMGPAIGADAVVFLQVPEETLLARIAARGRPDDTPEVFKKRLATYRNVTVPAVERLGKSLPVLTPEAGGDKDSSYAKVKAALDDFLAGRKTVD